MAEEKELGEIFGYYSKLGVAAIKLKAAMAVGDTIHIKGHTTDFKQKVESMQIENKIVSKAKKGDDVGIKVKDKVRPNDKVYKAK